MEGLEGFKVGQPKLDLSCGQQRSISTHLKLPPAHVKPFRPRIHLFQFELLLWLVSANFSFKFRVISWAPYQSYLGLPTHQLPYVRTVGLLRLVALPASRCHISSGHDEPGEARADLRVNPNRRFLPSRFDLDPRSLRSPAAKHFDWSDCRQLQIIDCTAQPKLSSCRLKSSGIAAANNPRHPVSVAPDT